jgi:RND family efflux transporter MFP subunit
MNEVPTPTPNQNSPQVRRLLRLALYIAIVGCAVAAWGIFSRLQARAALAQAAQQAAIPTVAVTAPRHSSSADELVLPGTVQPYTDAPIYARSSGYVRRWYADIGKSVKAGDVLAEIETPEVDAQYRQAQADLATAEANNRLAQITAARYQTLRKSGLVAQQDVDNAQGDADAKKAQVDSARQNLSRLEELEAFNRITAPFDGVVTARRIDVGALVNAGMTSGEELFHLTATRRLRVYVNVPQSYAPAMVPGLMAELTVVEHPNQRFPARVVSTARSIDTTSRTLLTELEADNTKGELLTGAFAEVHLPLPASLERWRLPSNTLIFRGEGSEGLQIATVDAQNHVHLHQVSLGRDFGSEVEVLSGVGESDRVILNPLDSLADGAAVRIVNGGS